MSKKIQTVFLYQIFNMKNKYLFKQFSLALLLLSSVTSFAQKNTQSVKKVDVPFEWNGANVYFLVTDRFNNGEPGNDVMEYRDQPTAVSRGFLGGDIKGIIKKIKEGYFTNLGINALWFTPVFEQSKGMVDEGTGNTYAYHGYWPRDWTAIDPNFGTHADLKELVEAAHNAKIRVLFDVVMNHIGPTTELDAPWPTEWVRTEPTCQYTNYENTTSCTLVKNLPDVRTDSNENVELPPFLVEKWKNEGRYEQELAELDSFFARTGYPKAPKYYIIKWLTDYIKKYGVDGFRFDTVKHLEEEVFNHVKKEGLYSLDFWKDQNPDKVLDSNPFFLLAETYGYGISAKRNYDFGDKVVDYFANGFDSQINFQFSHNSKDYNYEQLFFLYDSLLQSDEMKGLGVLNYLASHDDPNCFDVKREKPFEAANKLLLAPGAAQVYYGDETSRPLEVAGASGDANLRAFMNWNDLAKNKDINGVKVNDILTHWQKLGRFRKNHLAVGLGKHQMITSAPYVFSRVYEKNGFKDVVIIGLDLAIGKKELSVNGLFKDGTFLKDAYSGKPVVVKKGKAIIDSEFTTVLLEVK